MKAVQVTAPGVAEFVEVDKPEVKPGYVLVRNHRLSLCGSDINMLHFSEEEYYPFPPGTTGHEVIGYVEAIGETDETDLPFKVGDLALVLVEWHRGMADYCIAPIENILPIPAGLDPEHALQAQQFGTVIYACKVLPNMLGKSVAVVGQGSAGQWFNFMAKRLGASQIIAIDLQAHRLKLSEQYGATHTIHNKDADAKEMLLDITDGVLPDVVIEATGEVSGINLAFSLCKVDGFMLQFGVPRGVTLPIAYREVFYKRVNIQCMVHALVEPNHESTRMALDMIASGEADVAPLITHRFSFDDVHDAYTLQNTYDEGAVKIIIEMSE